MKITLVISAVLLCLPALALAFQAGGQLTAPPPGSPAREPGLYARIETTMGNITAKLFETETPITVKNFVDLAEGKKPFRDPKTGAMVTRPFYNGISFHRVIPRFMAQVGDPTGTGSYSGGFVIPDEFVPSITFDRPGRLAMANAGPKTGSTQFFITEVPLAYLNGKHTIFGQVVEGQNVVTKITGVPRDANDKPRTPVTITRVVIERVGSAPAASAAPPTQKGAPAKR
jgi:peptidyl-prolyl cis-trans isomerase A (cyclophilin A)